MSDLADALSQYRLTVQALDRASIDLGSNIQAPLDAADYLASMDDLYSDTEAAILNAKAASNYVKGSDFDVDAGDLLQPDLEADLIDGFV